MVVGDGGQVDVLKWEVAVVVQVLHAVVAFAVGLQMRVLVVKVALLMGTEMIMVSLLVDDSVTRPPVLKPDLFIGGAPPRSACTALGHSGWYSPIS
jgi:hypothetical protein